MFPQIDDDVPQQKAEKEWVRSTIIKKWYIVKTLLQKLFLATDVIVPDFAVFLAFEERQDFLYSFGKLWMR